MQVANTILQQLGGGRFIAMTGARLFCGDNTSLQFSIPTAKGINKVRIVLDPSDTYTVEFYNLRGTKITKKAAVNDIYAEDLCDVFEDHTGLYTSL